MRHLWMTVKYRSTIRRLSVLIRAMLRPKTNKRDDRIDGQRRALCKRKCANYSQVSADSVWGSTEFASSTMMLMTATMVSIECPPKNKMHRTQQWVRRRDTGRRVSPRWNMHLPHLSGRRRARASYCQAHLCYTANGEFCQEGKGRGLPLAVVPFGFIRAMDQETSARARLMQWDKTRNVIREPMLVCGGGIGDDHFARHVKVQCDGA